MATAPTAEIHQKQVREVLEQATVEPSSGPGLGFTLCLDELPTLEAYNATRARALVLQDPQIVVAWLNDFEKSTGQGWEGGLHGGINGLFACPGVTL